MSTNLELPTAAGLKELAPNKTRKTILTPMRQIQRGIQGNHGNIGRIDGNRGLQSITKGESAKLETEEDNLEMRFSGLNPSDLRERLLYQDDEEVSSPVKEYRMAALPKLERKQFVPAGQSTQMIIGATPENDYQIMTVAQALYRQYDLKRVFYSAYIAMNDDSKLPAVGTKPPLLREHRLYQADWLLRYYGFEAGELLTEEQPNFNVYLDPKCEWALRHLEYFPVEINKATYQMLLRVPGIGVKSARRIVGARKSTMLNFDALKRIGVVLKRAHYFITCNGKMMYQTKIDEDYITRRILELDRRKNWELDYDVTFKQLSLFDDFCG